MKVRMKTVVVFYWGLDTWARREKPQSLVRGEVPGSWGLREKEGEESSCCEVMKELGYTSFVYKSKFLI